MKRFCVWSLAATTGLAAFGSVTSPVAAATFVSTELVLSVDVSNSINDAEFALQRSGYANVFRTQSVIDLIKSLDNGIAVTFQYWASQPSGNLSWYHITDERSAHIFARDIERASRPFGGLTNMAGALQSARQAILSNPFVSDRQVIDISSDGRQNTQTNFSGSFSINDLCAPRVTRITVFNDDLADSCLNQVRNQRNAAVAAGITVNGLPILTEFSTLSSYFRDNVIGGPGAFVQPTSSFSDFQQAITAKVTREIAITVEQQAAAQPPPAG